MEYLLVKWIHILSSVLLVGIGLGSAFYKYMTDRSRDINAIAVTNKNVVLADWLFTTPTIVIQPLTGFIMVWISGYTLSSSWLIASIILYVIAGACWIPVVFLQIKMREISIRALNSGSVLPDLYWYYTRIWFWLGVPAFVCMIMIYFLMVYKPQLF